MRGGRRQKKGKLENSQLPAGVTGLDAGLAHVKRDGFAHCEVLLWVVVVVRVLRCAQQRNGQVLVAKCRLSVVSK